MSSTIALTLVKTGEEHTNGMPIYRKKGDRRSSSHRGKTGIYFIYDGTNMYRCGRPYKDEYGCFDGEPLWPVMVYTITEA